MARIRCRRTVNSDTVASSPCTGYLTPVPINTLCRSVDRRHNASEQLRLQITPSHTRTSLITPMQIDGFRSRKPFSSNAKDRNLNASTTTRLHTKALEETDVATRAAFQAVRKRRLKQNLPTCHLRGSACTARKSCVRVSVRQVMERQALHTAILVSIIPTQNMCFVKSNVPILQG